MIIQNAVDGKRVKLDREEMAFLLVAIGGYTFHAAVTEVDRLLRELEEPGHLGK